jgi:hypothetical protein
LCKNKREHFNNNRIDEPIPAEEKDTDSFPVFVLLKA